MVKVKESLRCKLCKQVFKSKRGLTIHSKTCSGPNKNINKCCELCSKIITTNHYYEHFSTCHKRKFFEIFRGFLNFLFKLITQYNKENDIKKYARFIEIKKYLIYKIKINNITDKLKLKELEDEFKNSNTYIKDNMNIYKNIINEIKKEENEQINEIKKELKLEENKENINKFNQINSLIQTIKYNDIPNISFRDIVINYIYSNDLENKKIKKALDRIYGKKDFLTENEIKKTDFYPQFKDLCNSDLYCKNYNKFYDMLNTFANNTDSYRCIFCSKFILHKLAHLKICKVLKKIINEDNKEENYIKIIKYVFEETQYEKLNLKYLIKKYLNRKLEYFLNNIYNNIIDYDNFNQLYTQQEIEKIDKEKKETIRNLNELRKENKLKKIDYSKISILTLKMIINLEIDLNIHVDKKLENLIKDEILYYLTENNLNNENNLLFYLKNMKEIKDMKKEEEKENKGEEKENEENKVKENKDEEKENEENKGKENKDEEKENEDEILEEKSNNEEEEKNEKEDEENISPSIRKNAENYFRKIYEIRKEKRKKRHEKEHNKFISRFKKKLIFKKKK